MFKLSENLNKDSFYVFNFKLDYRFENKKYAKKLELYFFTSDENKYYKTSHQIKKTNIHVLNTFESNKENFEFILKASGTEKFVYLVAKNSDKFEACLTLTNLCFKKLNTSCVVKKTKYDKNNFQIKKNLKKDTLMLFFETNKYDLNTIQKAKIDSFISKIHSHLDTVNIWGFADSSGNFDDNLKLSNKRSKEVSKYFLKKVKNPINNIGKGELILHKNSQFNRVVFVFFNPKVD